MRLPADRIRIDVFLHRQSPDIAEAVARSLEQREGLSEKEDGWNAGAGDQGIMTGFACQETPSLMPMPVVLANRIVRELSACRKSGYIAGILPDGKAQVTVEYEDGEPVRLSLVLCQEKVQVKSELFLQHSIPLILPILPSFLISAHTHSRIRLVIDIHNDCVFGLYCKMSLCIQIPVCVHAHSLIF